MKINLETQSPLYSDLVNNKQLFDDSFTEEELHKFDYKDNTNYSHYEHIDDFLKTQEMPEEYKNIEATVFCNDCEMDSKTSYHFIYNKCCNCNGYNTNIKNTFLI